MPKNAFGNWIPNIVAVTGTTRTILASENGTLFTNRGAGAGCTFTLPITSTQLTGCWFEFVTVVAQAIVIATSPPDTLVVHADATADSITSAATIGQHFRVVCDGTGWLVESNPSAASAATAVTAVTLAT